MRLFLALASVLLLFGCVEVANDAAPGYEGPRQIEVKPPSLSFNNTAAIAPADENLAQNLSDLAAMVGTMNGSNDSSLVSYYYSPDCPYCQRLIPLIEQLNAQFGNGSIGSINVLTPEGFGSFNDTLSALNASQRVVPFVVAGNRTLVGLDEINSSLWELLYNLTNQSGTPR